MISQSIENHVLGNCDCVLTNVVNENNCVDSTRCSDNVSCLSGVEQTVDLIESRDPLYNLLVDPRVMEVSQDDGC